MATPVVTLKSQTHYISDGATTLWDFSFAGGYLSKDHVKAYKRDTAGARTEIPLVASNFVTATRLSITGVPNGHRLVIYRATPTTGPLVDWQAASTITRPDLDTTAKQSIFVAAEASDLYGVTTERDLVDLATAAAAAAGTASTAASNASASASAAAVARAAAEAASASLTAVKVATFAGQPHVGIGNAPVGENKLLVVSRETLEGDGIVNGVQIQHRFDKDTGPGFTGTRGALRVINMIGNAGGTPRTLGTTWAINAIADLQDNITTGESSVAVSGTIFKRGKYQHAISGHYSVRDSVDFAVAGVDVTPSVATEMNLTCIGPDSTVTNDGFGSRHCLTVWARTDLAAGGPSTPRAEIGSGIMMQPYENDIGIDGQADFRNGLVVRDRWQYGATSRFKQSGVRVDTGGQYGVFVNGNHAQANIWLAAGSATYGHAAYGIIANGTYTSGTALRINAGQAIALDATNSVKMVYNSSNNRIEFIAGGAVRGYIDCTGANHAL